MAIFRSPLPRSRFPILLSAALLMMPGMLMADDQVMAPPTVTSSGQALPDNPIETLEEAPNLRDELQEPDKNTAVDIRSYKRKDGTQITEYGAKGQVFQIKVQPPGGMPAYYLYLNPNGQFERRRISGAKPTVPPSWILKEF